MKDKHGIMVKFLTTILLAIIIFAPACYVSSKFFTLSEQAKDNFNDFTKAINEANKKELGHEEIFMFIQDQNSYIYPITEKSRGVHITNDPIFGEDVDFTLSYTPECANQNCYCLCRSYEDQKDKTCYSLVCVPMPEVKFSEGTGILIDRGDKGPRRQAVRIIKCESGQEYCKKSDPGDISIVFQWLEEFGVYDGVK